MRQGKQVGKVLLGMTIIQAGMAGSCFSLAYPAPISATYTRLTRTNISDRYGQGIKGRGSSQCNE